MLLRSKTTHSRAFPQKHSFSYSYLFVGTPVDYQGRAGSILSVDVERKKGWFDIQASDYLDRGGTGVGLRGKLEAYLRSQGVEERRYPYGYFVTAPRFLGYSFNPVSFWYLYDQNKALKAMVLEVNNTFDERRMYLLHATDAEDSASSRADSSQNGDATSDVVAHAEKRARPHAVEFTNAWEKDFHVSPFNSRKGTYTLVAHDPFYSKNGTQHVIDNTIVLKSSKQHAKLVAQVFSDGIPLDPKSLSRWDTFRFVISWWWVGLVTFPRIVKEAYKLYFKRKLHVWFRPEVTLSSIGRNATDTEKVLEGFYQQYFADLVYSATVPIQLSYTPSSGLGDARVFISQSSMIHHDTLVPCLNIKILSPAFYSRFVHYAHTSEAFDRECLCTDEKNQTVSVSDARLLNNLLSTGKPPVSAALPTYLFDGLRWDMMRRLRCPPAAPAYPPPLISDANTAVKDIRSLALSPVDRFVRDHCADAWLYRRKVTELFLAQRFAFGFTVVVGAADLLFRLLLICLAQYWLAGGPQSEASRAGHGTYSVIAARAVDLVVVNMVHVWAFAKGF
ncbi:hypothetical protein BJ546DRAFT_846103 [Cryomyces antarcticus]